MKVSIITCVLNNEKYIQHSIKSFQNQSYNYKEQIILDGGSTDNTIKIIEKYKNDQTIFLSNQDNGIYHAINMGINISSGDIVGILHSDDFYENDDVIYDVVDVFRETQADLVYGDLVYVSKNNQNRKLRDWKAGEFLEKYKKRLDATSSSSFRQKKDI